MGIGGRRNGGSEKGGIGDRRKGRGRKVKDRGERRDM
jgi:hypothetical protein